MLSITLPGLGEIPAAYQDDLVDIASAGDGVWRVGCEGVLRILTPRDRKVAFIVFAEKTLAYITSSMGTPALYPVPEVHFDGPAEAVLMDLDGTSVHSESFWVWVIEQVTARLLGDPAFTLAEEDAPFVSGHSVSEHLQYCLRTYAPSHTVEEARALYFAIVRYEMAEILAGRGRPNAFTPSPDLKEFLLTLKAHGVKIGLVTSGLYEKAWPEILSAFQTLGMGDPLAFYDAIITAGIPFHGQCGTLGELAPKPHPWLYAETARVGMGLDPARRHRVIGIEDSGAGVVSIRLAGFAAIGIDGGNITASGTRPFVLAQYPRLLDALPLILG